MRKLNFKDWKIIDIDHNMKGNSYFSAHQTEDEWMQKYEDNMGTHEQRFKTIKDQDEYKDF